ncbi:MAG: hypothetical protein JSS72_12125 [Armatimonadetes bacterium]|nr:hypothetical protein [Armatimonadota bacterium]
MNLSRSTQALVIGVALLLYGCGSSVKLPSMQSGLTVGNYVAELHIKPGAGQQSAQRAEEVAKTLGELTFLQILDGSHYRLGILGMVSEGTYQIAGDKVTLKATKINGLPSEQAIANSGGKIRSMDLTGSVDTARKSLTVASTSGTDSAEIHFTFHEPPPLGIATVTPKETPLVGTYSGELASTGGLKPADAEVLKNTASDWELRLRHDNRFELQTNFLVDGKWSMNGKTLVLTSGNHATELPTITLNQYGEFEMAKNGTLVKFKRKPD